MKKFVRVMLIIALSFLVLGVFTGGVGLAWCFATADRLTPETPVSEIVVLDPSALQEINLNLNLGDVRFHAAEDASQARVETTGYVQDELTIVQQDGVLTIESPSGIVGGMSMIDFGWFRIDWLGRLHIGAVAPRRIDLYLPSEELKSIQAHVDVGDLSSDTPLAADMLQLHCSTGSLSLNGVEAEEISLSSSVGSIDVDGFSCGDLSVQIQTGDLSLYNGSASGRAEIVNQMGNLSLNGLEAEEISLSSSVGSIDVDGFSCGDLSVQIHTGDLSLCNGSASGRAEIVNQMGDMELTDVELHTLLLDNGFGDLTFRGALRDVCSLEAKNGDMELCFTDSPENYSMRLTSSDMGDVDVGTGAEASWTRAVDSNDYLLNDGLDTANQIEIACYMGGDVSVQFEP